MLKIIAIVAFLYITSIECEITKGQRQLAHDHETAVRLLKRLYTDVELKKPERFKSEENIVSWAFDDHSTDNAIKIYTPPNNIKNPFVCQPNVTSCYNIKINNFTEKFIGTYQRKSDSVDRRTDTIVKYLVYGYEMHVKCKSHHGHNGCSYNESTNTLTVKEKQDVFITCITKVHGHKENGEDSSTLELSIDHRFNDNNECKERPHDLNNDSKDDGDDDGTDAKDSYKIVRKTCHRSFKRTDSLYACVLRNATEQLDKTYKLDLGKIDIKLNITYGPELNETEFLPLKLGLIMSIANTLHLSYILSALLVFSIFIQAY